MSSMTNGGTANEQNEATSFIEEQSNAEKETKTKEKQSIEHTASIPKASSSSANCVYDMSQNKNQTIDPNACVNRDKCFEGIKGIIPPFFFWIRNYDWRKDLPADCLAGITICVLLIPQVR